jgi:hypothetical protein
MESNIFDRFFGLDGINPYGNPFEMDRLIGRGDELTPSELQSMLKHALEIEDYQMAAEVRDKLNKLRCG